MTCLASGVASTVSIAEVQAWTRSEDTSLLRSSAMVILLRRSAEEPTSTKERATCLLPVTTVTSPLSVLDSADELKELEVLYP